MNEAAIREKQITKTSLIGILTNLLLAAFKGAVGLISGSIAIVLDAVNNLTDAMSSVITIVGIKLARRKPDRKHPFGYGRIEYFSAILIAGIVLAAGVTSLIESVKKIFAPEIADYTFVTVLIIAVAVAVKLLLGRYVTSQGKKYNSDALIASGSDASFDAVISASTLVGAAVTLIFHISVDGIIGTIISLFILKAGLEMLLGSVSDVMGTRYDSEITMAIKKAVREIDGVGGAYDLVLHNYGPDKAMGSIHIEVPSTMSAAEIHRITRTVQDTVVRDFNVFLTVGLYAIDPAKAEERAVIHELAMSCEGAIGTHGMVIDDVSMEISFDTVVDFTVTDKAAFVRELTAKVKEHYPSHRISISLDANYSD